MDEKQKKMSFREKIKEKVSSIRNKVISFQEKHPKAFFLSLLGLLGIGSALGFISAEANKSSSDALGDCDAHDSSSMTCPNCGTILIPDAPEGWFNCHFCGDRFYYNGITLKSRNEMERSEDGPVCDYCGLSLSGGDYTGAREDGNNAYPYVICPHCRHKKILWQFGDE